MKKILALFLALVMILTISACNSAPDDFYDEDAKKDDLKNTEDSDNNGENNSVNMNSISYASGYKNGLMQVGEHRTDGKLVMFFVNKKGERVFDLPQNEGKEYIYNSFDSGFFGKYYPVTQADRDSYNFSTARYEIQNTVLIDTSGNLINPTDVGVTDFLAWEKDIALDMMSDGYILAKIDKESYSEETATSLLVLDNDFKKLADLSGIVEIDDLYKYKYFHGFIYKEDKAIDLKNGKVYSNIADVYSQIILEHKSDWWEYRDGGYYDIRDTEKKIVLSMDKFPDTRDGIFYFSDGLCAIMFESSGNYYFSIMDENGEMLFEPVKISGQARVYSCNGVYAVLTNKYLYTFNKNGKIAELAHQTSTIPNTLCFSEDVIVARFYPSSVYVYTPDLKALF